MYLRVVHSADIRNQTTQRSCGEHSRLRDDAFRHTHTHTHTHTHFMELAYVNTGQNRDAARKATFMSGHSGIHTYCTLHMSSLNTCAFRDVPYPNPLKTLQYLKISLLLIHWKVIPSPRLKKQFCILLCRQRFLVQASQLQNRSVLCYFISPS